MEITLKDFECKTVKSTYSWDEGVPTGSRVVPAVSSTDTGRYVGYAPTVIVSLSASISDLNPNHYAFKRTVDFGDYYNSETNVQTALTQTDEFFCHTYVMPGEYTLKITQTQYSVMTSESEQYTYREDGIAENDILPHEWKWYSFFCDDPEQTPLIKSYSMTWDDCIFQSTTPMTWNELSNSSRRDFVNCPCVPSPTVWNWYNFLSGNLSDELEIDPLDPNRDGLRWKSYSLSGCAPLTWRRLIQTTDLTECRRKVPPLTAETITHTKELFLKVLEIPPVAYLEVVEVQSNKISPYTVQLSPKKIRCGSFPIERLIWDFGDGSPLLEQVRGEVKSEYPFVFMDAFDYDSDDVRNYDVLHTYRRSIASGNCFYPSVTAIAFSTETQDCASAVIGPLLYEPPKKVSLLQNKLMETEDIVYTGQIDDGAVLWKTDN